MLETLIINAAKRPKIVEAQTARDSVIHYLHFLSEPEVTESLNAIAGGKYFADLVSKFAIAAPEMPWYVITRLLWPVLAEAYEWIDIQKIPQTLVYVNPTYTSNHDHTMYSVRATLCNHSGGGCDCGNGCKPT